MYYFFLNGTTCLFIGDPKCTSYSRFFGQFLGREILEDFAFVMVSHHTIIPEEIKVMAFYCASSVTHSMISFGKKLNKYVIVQHHLSSSEVRRKPSQTCVMENRNSTSFADCSLLELP